MTIILIFIVLLISGSSNNQIISEGPDFAIVKEIHTKNILTKSSDSFELKEYFSDSIRVGRKKYNKVEISIYGNDDSSYSVVKFYTLVNSKWKLRNDYRFEHNTIMFNPEFSDFNNDGLNDLTYISKTAARGANEIRRLLIYDKQADRLINVVNSEDYPNLEYNRKLKCIDAFMVHGGSATVFLRLRGDSLKEFAVVSLNQGLNIRTVDRFGNEKIIYSDPSVQAGYIRFSTYKPKEVLKELTESEK